MVFTELKPQMEQLSPKEMVKAMAFLKHRLRADAPENKRDLARRLKDIEGGQRVTLAEAKRRLRSA
jgi:hypothetical protein